MSPRTFIILLLQLFTLCNIYSLKQDCSFSVTPDIELISSSNNIDNEIQLTFNRFSDDYLGSSAPSNTLLKDAKNTYNNLNITINNNDISSNNINNLKNKINLIFILTI